MNKGRFYSILITVLLLTCGSLRGQDSIRKPAYFGIGVEAYLSMSGHGGYYGGYGMLSKGKHMLRIGACMQKRNLQVNGCKLLYSYRVASMNGEDIYSMSFSELRVGACQVNVQGFVQYLNNAVLSYKRSKEEGILSKDSTINWGKVTLSTLEIGVVAELALKFTKKTFLNAFIGISYYNHLNYFTGIYNDKSGPVLILGAGISLPGFKTRGKKK
ncbi:MAG: hypothetical protein ACXVP0_17265 [Bacteroidia bacterium]